MAAVLVVEDNTDSAETLGMLLTIAGHEVRMAHSGPEAVRVAAEWRPGVVLCDIGLPGFDGWEVARRLRADPGTAGARLVAVTAYDSDEARDRSREAGFDGHLVKPASFDELQRLMGS
jgi:CheY-like chemotaxis protein